MRIVVAPAFQQHTAFISQIPRLMEQGQCEIVYDKRNLVARFRHEGLTFMVKRFKRVNFVQQIVYSFFRATKCERAYRFAGQFLQRGIATPQPIAYLEDYRCGLFTTGYFVSEEVEGTETHLLLREVQQYPSQLAQAVAQQIVLMHSKGILHGDLNLSNFLCTEDTEGYHFMMIDTNRSKFCNGYPSDDACMNNLVRLTHRRDLYEDLIRRYALLRGWDADCTVCKALSLLDHFENRKIRL